MVTSPKPHDILRLHRCPKCSYDLTGLPRGGKCPECGFAYDAMMFLLDQKPTRTSVFARFGGFTFIVVVLIIGIQWWSSGRIAWYGLIGIIVVTATMLVWFVINRNSYSAAPLGGAFLFCNSDGIVEYRDDGPQPLILWRDCGSVRMSARRNHGWRLKIYHGRDKIINPYEVRLRMAQCVIRFEATSEAADAVLHEVERRIARAAHA
jgi:hypothetical protein